MHETPFLSLLLITALAVFVPFIVTRVRAIRLPIVVGEILAGIVVGTSGFNLIEHSAIIDFLAEFGFAFLMFLSGLEVDFSILSRPRGPKTTPSVSQNLFQMAISIVLTTIGLAVGSSFILREMGIISSPFLMGLILSTTSLGVVAPVLKEQGLTVDNAYGQAILITATLADFLTLILLTVVIAGRSGGVTLDLLLIPVLLLAFAMAARLGRVFRRIPSLRHIAEELSHATAQIRVRGAIALMIAWVALAEALGVELILGAFLAGAIVNLTSGPSTATMREKLDAIGYGVFIPIFFIMVGVRFELRTVLASTQALLMVPLLLVVAYGVKLIPALLLRRRFSWRETLAGGFLLSSRLSLIIAAASIALDIGAIPESVSNAVILVAIATCTVSPLLFNRLHQRAVLEKREGVIIFGSDPMAELLIRRLIRYGEKITLVTSSGVISEHFPGGAVAIMRGSGADPELLRQAGAETARSLMVLFSEKEVGVDICRMARMEFGIPTVVAGVADGDTIQTLNSIGVRTVQPVLSAAMAFEGALHFPTAFDLLVDLDDDVEIGEARLHNRFIAGLPLRRVRLPGNVLVLSIQRDNAALVPHGDTILQAGDRIALVGAPKSVSETVRLLSTSD